MIKFLLLTTMFLTIGGASVSANSKIQSAPYNVVQSVDDPKIEIRHYDTMVLVSTSMAGDNRNGAFRKLFDYISGNNISATEIPMTTPVFMDDKNKQGKEIPMTTPVFMDDKAGSDSKMFFVLPDTYTFETAPKPKNEAVKIEEWKDYKVAAIIFSGTLSQSNIEKNKKLLKNWMDENGYIATGDYRTAGYNAPWTLPFLRRNEVLIPVKK